MIETTVISNGEGGYVYIDTRDTWDAGWETMAFPCGDQYGNKIDFGTELYQERYPDMSVAHLGHAKAVLSFLEKIV